MLRQCWWAAAGHVQQRWHERLGVLLLLLLLLLLLKLPSQPAQPACRSSALPSG